MSRGLKSYGRRRNLLHKNQLEEFRKWLKHNTEYFEVESRGFHAYEIMRINKYDPQGDHNPIIFFRREPPSEHITVQVDGVPLVERFLKERKGKDAPRSSRKKRNQLPVTGRPS